MARPSGRGASIIFRTNQSLNVVGSVLAQSLWGRLFKTRTWDVGFDRSNSLLVVQPKQSGNGLSAIVFSYLHLCEHLGLCEFFA